MISALTVNHNKVIREVNSDDRWMVLGTFSSPSTELVNLSNGEVKSFGDNGLTANDFTETDEILEDQERHDGFEKMSYRRKFGFYEGGKERKASVHELRAVEKEPKGCFLSESPIPDNKYIDMISQEINRLKEHCDAGRLRGIAISYVLTEDENTIAGSHNFITDGRGIATLNAGIDLVKQYIVDVMRENFGVKK